MLYKVDHIYIWLCDRDIFNLMGQKSRSQKANYRKMEFVLKFSVLPLSVTFTTFYFLQDQRPCGHKIIEWKKVNSFFYVYSLEVKTVARVQGDKSASKRITIQGCDYELDL